MGRPSGCLDVDYILDNYKGSPKLTLGPINMTFFSISLFYPGDSKIYNLLDKITPRRRLRCGCVKSYCEAKYCECYRAGETCGEDCLCVGCRNRKPRRTTLLGSETEQIGCNCVKSGCLKKYCECFQKGKKCGPHCHCSYCQNYEEDEAASFES